MSFRAEKMLAAAKRPSACQGMEHLIKYQFKKS